MNKNLKSFYRGFKWAISTYALIHSTVILLGEGVYGIAVVTGIAAILVGVDGIRKGGDANN